MASVTSLLTADRLVLPLWPRGLREPETSTGTAPYRAPLSTRTELVPKNLAINPNLTEFLQETMSRVFADTADRPDLPADARSRIQIQWETAEEAAVDRPSWMEADISGVLEAACRVVIRARGSVGRLRQGSTSSNAPTTDDRSIWAVQREMWGRLDEAKTEGVRSLRSRRFSYGPSS